jgi:hypothetical protein
MIPLVCCWEHFPEKRGLVTGIIESAYGLGSFIFSLISTALVNPDNAKPLIIVKDGDSSIHYFTSDIANNV